MVVLKFGGTSVGRAKAIRQVFEIVNAIPESKVVVVSALSGVTDSLIKASSLAKDGNDEYKKVLSTIKDKHREVSIELFGEELDSVKELLTQLEQILFSIYNLRELSDRANAFVQSFGERLSARIVAHFFQTKGIKSVAVDATSFLLTSSDYLDANPLYEESEKRTQKVLSRYLKEAFVPVITGYIGTDADGSITTLGRGGSDFTATLLGRFLDAREVRIYTDVDGILTADPKIVPTAKTIDKLSFAEVRELSYFGAKVMHSKSLIPAMEKNIPVRVMNTFNPDTPGTLITNETEINVAKAISSINDINLVSIVGKGMQGKKFIAKRVFETASENGVNVIMFDQSSSEQTIDVFVKSSDEEQLINGLKEEFKSETELKLIDRIGSKKNLSVISVIGEGINALTDIKKEIFKVAYDNDVNVVSVVQGSSLDSISFVVKSGEAKKVINLLHDELGLNGKKVKLVNLFQFGVGGVGKELIRIVEERKVWCEENLGIRFNYVGLARSNSFAMGDEVKAHIEGEDFNFAHKGSPLQWIKQLPKNTIIIDVSNSDTLRETLLELLSLGYNAVTSNKKNLATDFDSFEKLTKNKGKLLFETTVGAALPIIKTIRDFILSGDTVNRIVMLPSGTLSFIFTLFNRGVDFKEAINKAISLGYTEPNPIDDLMGMDLLRKGKILSFLTGRRFSSADIEFTPFTNEKTLEGFFNNEYENFVANLKALSKEGVVYPVAQIDDKLKISIKSFPKDSAFGNLKEGENIFEIYLRSTKDLPITVRGIGAGYHITAEGVFQDILGLGVNL
jgi:aspartokinase/homoserine dehydrogenase 1